MVPTAVILQPSRDEITPICQDLWDVYKGYCLTISRRSMALSIETCSFALWLCEATRATRVADIGSGFTSYVLRRYAADRDDITVVSVDDNPHWLKQTAQFLRDHDLPATNLYGPEQWAAADLRFDLIVYDYASGNIREAGMAEACAKLSDTGVILFDDAQHAGHHHQMAAACREAGMQLLDVFHQTVDETGRFATLGVHP